MQETSIEKQIIEKAYIVRFRKGNGAVNQLNFLAKNDEDAKKKSEKFCSSHQFRHIYTKPFFTDLEGWKDIV